MKKAAVILIAILLLAGTVFAAAGDTIVYVTKSGEKYHTESCNLIKKNKKTVTLQFAYENDYTACKKCKPPLLDASNVAKLDEATITAYKEEKAQSESLAEEIKELQKEIELQQVKLEEQSKFYLLLIAAISLLFVVVTLSVSIITWKKVKRSHN